MYNFSPIRKSNRLSFCTEMFIVYCKNYENTWKNMRKYSEFLILQHVVDTVKRVP